MMASPYLSSPTSNDHDDTRSMILVAAREEFVRFGLRGARMQDIADRAGINKALLHYYFRSKEGLYEASIAGIMKEVIGAIRATLLDGSAPLTRKDRLKAIVATYFRVFRANPQFPTLMLREMAEGGPYLEQVVQSFESELKAIAGGITTLLIPDEDSTTQEGTRSRQHAIISTMSLIAGTFLFQPIYTRILAKAGMPVTIDEAFLQERSEVIGSLLEKFMPGENA